MGSTSETPTTCQYLEPGVRQPSVIRMVKPMPEVVILCVVQLSPPPGFKVSVCSDPKIRPMHMGV